MITPYVFITHNFINARLLPCCHKLFWLGIKHNKGSNLCYMIHKPTHKLLDDTDYEECY